MPNQSRWRNIAAPIIAKVIADNPDDDDKTLRRKISKEYPFGERAYHPYKIWLSEVKNQLAPPLPPQVYEPDPNQPDLF